MAFSAETVIVRISLVVVALTIQGAMKNPLLPLPCLLPLEEVRALL